MHRWIWTLLVVGAAGTQAFLWLSTVPLGIPGEWTWHRIPSEPDLVWNLLGVGFAALVYAGFVELGARRMPEPAKSIVRRLELSAWLAGLVILSFVWLWSVQEAAPSRSRLGKAAFVLYYASSSGYFSKARYENPNPAELLAGYEDLMRQHDVLHVGTHPPGLFLVFHGLIGVCERSQLVSSILDATQPSSFSKACDAISQNVARSRTQRLLLPADRRVLWLACLLVMASASLSALILYALVRRTHSVTAAWWTAAFWPAVPAVAVFVPKSDVAFSLVGLLIVWVSLTAADRRSVVLGFVTGLLAWCGLMMSLALLPVLLFAGMVCVLRNPSVDSGTAGDTRIFDVVPGGWELPPVRCLISSLCGFAIPTLLLGWSCRINMLTVWWLNFQNHASFYQQYARTYWKWLMVNPLELSFAAGWPVFLAALVALWSGLRTRGAATAPIAWSTALVWGALWLTGKNSGEAARLWIVFLPWLVWLGGPMLEQLPPSARRKWLPPVLVVLAIQLVVCALTVSCVNGFVVELPDVAPL